MKHDLINTGSKKSSDSSKEVTFVRRAGNLLAVGALALCAVGAVGVYASSGGKEISYDAGKVSVLTSSSSLSDESSESDTVSQVEVTWKEAGIDEYDLVVETVKATKNMNINKISSAKSTAEAAAKSSAGGALVGISTEKLNAKAEMMGKIDAQPAVVEDNSDVIKDCGVMTMYTTGEMNIRSEASLNSEILRVLPGAYEVTVTGYNNDWYRIKADGQTAYCLKRYLSSDRPEQVAVHHEGDVISYNETEFEMLCYVLQNEVGNCSEASKIAVANVIINRVKSPLFPNSIAEVLTQGDQFTAIYNYYNRVSDPNESTIQCARRALEGEDNTNGAIYYYAPQYSSGEAASWFETLTFCMEIDGQRYFK
ncbi:MAG: cell wall hydrolase [Ruminococcus sp.]|nr:cell wall hydrolase [Ruminococcus sp.]